MAVALCLIVGVVLHRIPFIETELWLAGGVAMLLGFVIAARSAAICCVLLAGALIAAGAALGRLDAFHFSADEVGLYTSADPSLAELELVADGESRRIANAHGAGAPDSQSLDCRVLAARGWSGWRTATGTISVRITHAWAALHAGSRFRAIGLLARPPPAMNPGQFDFAQYDRRQRVLVTFTIRGPDQIQAMGDYPPSPLEKIRAAAREKLDAGFAAGPDHDLLRALLLGDRAPELRPIADAFAHSGTSHHLATSGMHVMVVALLVYTICRLLLRPPRQSAALALIVTLLYGAATTPSAPIIRSILLAGAIGGGILLRRRTEGIQLHAIAMIAMLAWQPLDLYSAGFQLSFAAVAALMLLSGPIERWIAGIGSGRINPALRPPKTRLQRLISARIVKISATGIAAWLICAPLVAWHFRQFNPYAIAAGAMLEPLVFLSIIAGAIKITLTTLAPFMAGWWAAIAAIPTAALRHGVTALATIPGADWMTAAPSLAAIAGWYLLLCLPLLPPRGRWRAIKRLGPAAACVLGIVFLYRGIPSVPPGAIRLGILSVGAGQCAVAELPGGHAALFDAGSQGNAHLLRSCLDPYFRYRGIKTIDAIFISHPNDDHFNAVGEIARRYDVGRIYVAPQFIQEARHNASAGALLAELASLHRSPTLLSAGQSIRLNDDARVDVLWPADSGPWRDNEASLVLRLQAGERGVLFCGDIQEKAEKQLLSAPADLRADVLIAPHHGSVESTTGDFLRAVNPRWIISSNDATLTKKQREFDRLARGATLHRTHRAGAVIVTMDVRNRINVDTFRIPAAEVFPVP